MTQPTQKTTYIKGIVFVIIGLVLAILTKTIWHSTSHDDITIYAAASMTNAINDINQLYEHQYHTYVKTSFASSATLAKQIEQGAKVDIFISADTAWMGYLQQKNKLVDGTTKNLLGNDLVLIAPKNSNTPAITLDNTFDIRKILTGQLCTGNTTSVPVGKYAKQALTNLGWWNTIKPRLVETEDVRSALNFVNRGECQLGIVYTTDVAVVKNVKTIGVFPLATHTPIVYPIGMVKKSSQNAETQRYYEFLQSPSAKAIYAKYGFNVL